MQHERTNILRAFRRGEVLETALGRTPPAGPLFVALGPAIEAEAAGLAEDFLAEVRRASEAQSTAPSLVTDSAPYMY